MRIKQKITLLMVMVVIIISAGVNVLAKDQKVVDEAGLFTSSQEEYLQEKATRLIEKLSLDIVIVTTMDNKGKTSMDYADDYFDYNGYGIGEGADGILLLINMDDREVWISTHGSAIRYFNDSRIENILDAVYPHLGSADYGTAADVFLDQVESYVNIGVRSDQHTVYEDEINEETAWKMTRVDMIPLYFLISMGIGGIGICIMAMYNKGKSTTNAGTYNRSFNIINRRDQLVNTTVTHVTIKTQTSSSSPMRSGSSSGRSTVHRSSSGRTHGGGGRKF